MYLENIRKEERYLQITQQGPTSGTGYSTARRKAVMSLYSGCRAGREDGFTVEETFLPFASRAENNVKTGVTQVRALSE